MSTSFPAARVRTDFLEFFAARGHRIVPSAPVFPRDDPTLLFTNAGMNQFKDVFLGTGRRDYKRAADTQKCIRVSGKHNDLEEVGVDTYHHTFFEMLGNWSFGDYFKEEAIAWAWELLTETWGLPKDRLWVTVFGGDEKDGLPADVEAERAWIEKAGVERSHVLRFGRKDNFWEMGETGPCGPCTEIHIDRGGPGVDPRDGANPKIGVNAGNERFMEIWNLVFMQFNRKDDGRLSELPAKSVDTGMGFERVVSVLQGKRSNYDTDLFAPIFARVASISGRTYGGTPAPADVAFRVIADHARAVTSAISDGALPSNEGRGYVLRRLIRRASRFGRQALALEDPFLCEVVPAVAEMLGDTFPEMRQRCEHVQAVVRAEEEQFGRTLGRGLVLFEDLATQVRDSGTKVISGEKAFDLYATYGFPQDLVELMARENGLVVDSAGWDNAEKAHQDASRAEGKFKQLLSSERLSEIARRAEGLFRRREYLEKLKHELEQRAEWARERAEKARRGHEDARRKFERDRKKVDEVEALVGSPPGSVGAVGGFIVGFRSSYLDEGESSVRTNTEVLELIREPGLPDRLVIAESPFYPEGGGQVGDTGHIQTLDGRFEFVVEDTRRIGERVVHVGRAKGNIESGMRVVAEVNVGRRDRTRKNHTATHLLHRALKEVLGAHATQQGSYVGPDRLRFDFSHPKAVTPEELERIEALVNEKVYANADVLETTEDLESAKGRGVVAMFGEKYEDKVRVLDVGGWSLELCGGTHVAAAGDIGPFVIVSERAIQAGVRRIEALTGSAAVEEIQRQRRLLREAAHSLKTAPEEVPARLALLQKEVKEAKKKTAATSAGDVASALERLRAALAEKHGVAWSVFDAPDLGLAGVRDLADRAKSVHPRLAVALFGREEGRVPYVLVCQGIPPSAKLSAGDLAKTASRHLGGGGGGRPDLAQGQGQNAEALPAVLAEISAAIQAGLDRV